MATRCDICRLSSPSRALRKFSLHPFQQAKSSVGKWVTGTHWRHWASAYAYERTTLYSYGTHKSNQGARWLPRSGRSSFLVMRFGLEESTHFKVSFLHSRHGPPKPDYLQRKPLTVLSNTLHCTVLSMRTQREHYPRDTEYEVYKLVTRPQHASVSSEKNGN